MLNYKLRIKLEKNKTFLKGLKKRIRTKTQKAKRNNMYFLGRREKRKENKITF